MKFSRRRFLKAASATGIAATTGFGLSGTAAAACWPTLEEGDSNTAVTTAQYLLRAAGESLSVDGMYGSGTTAAVESFQSANGLTVDGIVGPNTWDALAVLVERGDEGAAVEAVQYNLDITIDGVYGSGTESAVETFQSSNGLSVDGIVGPNTWDAMVGTDCSGGGSGADFDYPATGTVSSPYGQRSSGFHAALDIANYTGTPIYAARSGVVDIRSYEAGGCGNYLKLGHDNGYQTMYCHLSSFDVYQGESVSRGQKIAEMGNTGSSTGPHLHFTVEQYQNHQYVPGADGASISAGSGIPKDYSGI